MNFATCSLCYPMIFSNPSFGEAMRHQADVVDNGFSEAYKKYLETGNMTAGCDWGNFQLSEHVKSCNIQIDNVAQYCVSSVLGIGEGQSMILPEYMLDLSSRQATRDDIEFHVKLSVEGICRRPALKQIESKDVVIYLSQPKHDLNDMSVSWNVHDDDYPEYLVTLKIFQVNSDGSYEPILIRYKHVAPPPKQKLEYNVYEIVWIPKLFEHSDEKIDKILHLITQNRSRCINSNQRRRGFGLELETVQMPPNHEKDYFTHLQQLHGTVKEAKESCCKRFDQGQIRRTEEIENAFNRLLLWDVSHDPQVENGAPVSRVDIYNRIREYISSIGMVVDDDVQISISNLILGGRISIPAEISDGLPETNPVSQCSPEYKSPPPPNELFHVFPPPDNGLDDADLEISLLLDAVLKNERVSSSAIVVPTVSDIGQSASSIHVHVNVINHEAWPRSDLELFDDIEKTRSLLGVVFGWIIFDRVVQSFSKPWMWRDRSLGPMFAHGPEFLWGEITWNHGTTCLESTKTGEIEMKMYNIPAFFRHIYKCFHDYDGSGDLFGKVFHRDVIYNTIFRNNSLNLLALDKYGTVEFRRLHATLDSEFISAYTWFCVGFVEKFCSRALFHQFVAPFIDDASSWEAGLEKLIKAQNSATLEDLIEIMMDPLDPVIPVSTFSILTGRKI